MKPLVSLMLVILLGAVLLGGIGQAYTDSLHAKQELEQQLLAGQAARREVETKLLAVTQQLAAVEAERDKIVETNKGLLMLVDQLKHDLQALRAENEALRGKVQELEERLRAAQSDNRIGAPQMVYAGAVLTPALLAGLVWSRYGRRWLMRRPGNGPQAPTPELPPAHGPEDAVSVQMTRQQARAYARWSQQRGARV